MTDNPLGKNTTYSSGYDPGLLFPIERAVNRKASGIPGNIFSGYDIWNCYEFGFLDMNGKPEVYRLRLTYPSDSEYIIESKSLKLYLFGFSMMKFKNTDEAIAVIRNDLKKILVTDEISIECFNRSHTIKYDNIPDKYIIDDIPTEINTYDPAPALLETEKTAVDRFIYYSDLLKSNCPVTGQPDWASVHIEYESKLCITRESMLKYIISFRNHQDYHENCCEKIFHDIYKLCTPSYLAVKCFFTRRGGIEINPVRYAGKNFEKRNDYHYWRQ